MIENFFDGGHKFSQIFEMHIKANTNKTYMKYDHYINQHMQAGELKLNEIIARNSHLLQSQDRTTINPLIRKFSHIP